MIKKTVTKLTLEEASSPKNDLAYWLARTPEERVEAVDYLRSQYNEGSTRLQRVARVIQRPQR